MVYTEVDNKTRTVRMAALLGAIFVIDELLFPVVHVGPIPFKISYLLAFAWLLISIPKARIVKAGLSGNLDSAEARGVYRCLWLLIFISIISELTLSFLTNVVSRTIFIEGIEFFLFYLGCFGLGYCCYRLNKNVFLYVLYIYCILNIVLAVFADYIPTSIYSFFLRDNELADRLRGTGGNPNTTLCQMNILLLAIVVFYRKGILKVSGIHNWLVIAIPVITNMVISSRGEFIQTCILEVVFIYVFLKNQRNLVKTLLLVILLGIILGLGYMYITQVLYNQNEAVRVAIDRINKLGDLTSVDSDSVKQTSTILRPFIHLEEFWNRFRHSPIWGCGYSAGSGYDFEREVSRYHNDIFKILASTGVLGGFLWIEIVRRFVKNGGFIVIIPFLTSAITNTFIQSTHAINLFFFVFGIVLHISNERTHTNE